MKPLMLVLLLAGCASKPAAPDADSLTQSVAAYEKALGK